MEFWMAKYNVVQAILGNSFVPRLGTSPLNHFAPTLQLGELKLALGIVVLGVFISMLFHTMDFGP